MENSKRTKKAIEKLNNIEDDLEYFTNGSTRYRKVFKELREFIDELGLDKKIDHARLAKRLKAHWKAEES